MADIAALRDALREFPDVELGPGADDEDVRRVEEQLGVTLPGTYRAFLREFGYADAGGWEFLGTGRGVPRANDVVEITRWERELAEPSMPQHLLPVLPDGAGNHYCLDLRRSDGDDTPVVVWNHEFGPDQEPFEEGDSFVSWAAGFLTEMRDYL